MYAITIGVPVVIVIVNLILEVFMERRWGKATRRIFLQALVFGAYLITTAMD